MLATVPFPLTSQVDRRDERHRGCRFGRRRAQAAGLGAAPGSATEQKPRLSARSSVTSTPSLAADLLAGGPRRARFPRDAGTAAPAPVTHLPARATTPCWITPVGVMRAHVPSALPDGNRADAAANKDSCASVAVDSGVWVHVVLAVAPSGRPILSSGPRERAWSSATAGYWTVTSRGWRTLISRSDARLAGLVLEPQIVGLAAHWADCVAACDVPSCWGAGS